MIKSAVVFVVLMAAPQGFAALKDSPVTQIENVTYDCTQPGGRFAFSLMNRTSIQPTVRVWQADPGVDQGFELEVTDFADANCPHCFDIKADLGFMGMKISYLFEVRSADGKVIDLTATGTQLGSTKSIKFNMPCHLVR